MFNILIVEDIEILRYDLRRRKFWGEDTGFQITQEASNGLEALNILESNKIDVVITDIKMPKMDGLSLLKEINEKKLCPIVVLFSDYTEFAYARQGLRYQAFDYIGKDSTNEIWLDLLKRMSLHLTNLNENFVHPSQLSDKLLNIEDANMIIDQFSRVNKLGLTSLVQLLDSFEIITRQEEKAQYTKLRFLLLHVIEGIFQNHPWLSFYIDKSPIKNVDFKIVEENHFVIEQIKQFFQQLFHLLKVFLIADNHKIVSKICSYILNHVDQKVTISMISEYVYMNKSYISELFKKNTGTTLVTYITMCKMERALLLLRQTNGAIPEISDQLYYSDPDYFCKVFKKYFGVSAHKYDQIQHLSNYKILLNS